MINIFVKPKPLSGSFLKIEKVKENPATVITSKNNAKIIRLRMLWKSILIFRNQITYFFSEFYCIICSAIPRIDLLDVCEEYILKRGDKSWDFF